MKREKRTFVFINFLLILFVLLNPTTTMSFSAARRCVTQHVLSSKRRAFSSIAATSRGRLFSRHAVSMSSKHGNRCLASSTSNLLRRNLSTETPKTTSTPKADNTVPETEKHADVVEKKTFQAETKQILDIMAKSLYTDREIFVRELISNASDACEKARYLLTHNGSITEEERPFEIHISVDEAKKTLTIQDFGIGMDKESMINHLGVIAKSGSKSFMETLKSGSSSTAASSSSGSPSAIDSIIGQFGVGFYSSFMVSDLVEVYSQSAESGECTYWRSDGTGTYEIAEASGVPRGTKVIVHLKDDAKEFSSRLSIERIVQKYSNFVGYPIYLNGEEVNTVGAVWALSPSSVTEEQYTSFYRNTYHAWDTPVSRLHFSTDAPLDLKALFYFPERHTEKYGMGVMEPGVSLYSRKVLIQANSPKILPSWLRFIKGVVDSEDIPLNVSRESMQDSSLVARMNSVLTRKVIRHLHDLSKKDAETYLSWYKEFGDFVKQGVCTDFNHKAEIAKLLRYESSAEDAGKLTSLDEYIARMPPQQEHIYFVVSQSRKHAEASPYYENLKANNIEALFMYSPIDEMVMKNIGEYAKKKVVSIESKEARDAVEGKAASSQKKVLDDDQVKELSKFLESALSDRVSEIIISSRLSSTPAVVTEHELASVRKLMRQVDQTFAQKLPKQKLEVNPHHDIMVGIYKTKGDNPELAKLLSEQVFDNALISADILDSPMDMLPRINKIMSMCVQKNVAEIVEDSK